MGSSLRHVRLYLVRHGETVDNVAQVYAGSRDSVLTNHGYEQAMRLGQYFKSSGLRFTHIFSSHLQRASKTAGLIREAQIVRSLDGDLVSSVPDVVQLPLLMEQDFGVYEGKKWYERPADAKLPNKEHYHLEHKHDANFVDVESRESMAQRADSFLEDHLLPLFDSATETTDYIIAVVSHGIMLSTLWRRLLLRLPLRSVVFAPELLESMRGRTIEHLGGWSNTGYLELHMTKAAMREPVLARSLATANNVAPELLEPTQCYETVKAARLIVATGGRKNSSLGPSTQSANSVVVPFPRKLSEEWKTIIQIMNGKDHLKGLKRTGGGVGSARRDASQKTIESFFKRRKIE